ncbi:MAG: hypothetical protein JNJ57_04930 [Saprospiraceae bacterium]|nr:hypothetical protein [Saprospiraceae bacterium]
MKLILKLWLPALSLLLFTCKEPYLDPGITPCLEEAIDAFKTKDDAWYIVKITGKTEPYYHFVSSYADFYNKVLDSKCELVCLSEGGWGGVDDKYLCGDRFNGFERDTIWHR